MRHVVSTAALGYDICPFTGKVLHKTEEAANAAMTQLRAERESGQKRHRRAYKCAACGGWHLTSRKK